MFFRSAAVVLATLFGSGAFAAEPGQANAAVVAQAAALKPYRPESILPDATLRLWGHGSFKHDFMRRLVDAWAVEFGRHHTGFRVDYRMYGTASAVGAVYTGAGDIALLGEEISPAAARAFRRAKGYAHTDISVATGSLDTNFFDYAHMVFVHSDNPLRKLSLAQLRAIFAGDGCKGAGSVRSWDEVGVGGTRAGARIQPYGWKTDVDFALFFRERVLADCHRWNPWMREFVHRKRADGTQYDHGQQIIDALAEDPMGIAISNVRYADDRVRALAISHDDEGPWVEASQASLVAQRYPLTRIIPAIVDRAPGEPLAPVTREFLRFLLSREGQQALLAHSGYLPLGPRILEHQLAKLQ